MEAVGRISHRISLIQTPLLRAEYPMQLTAQLSLNLRSTAASERV